MSTLDNLKHTDKELPEYGKRVLVWHPYLHEWIIAELHKSASGAKYFSFGANTLFLVDEVVTVWDNLPKDIILIRE